MTRYRSDQRGFVPPDFQLQLAESGLVPVAVALRTATFDATARRGRRSPERYIQGVPGNLVSGEQIRVFDLQGSVGSGSGQPVRRSGDGVTSDDRVVEAAFTHATIVQEFFATEFGRDSITGDGMPLELCVHYGDQLNNALWDGAQFLFGDGNGTVFKPFAMSLEVVAHEMSHAMIDSTSGLIYEGESGALNESFADVMAAMVVQRHRQQSVDEANWFIGAEALLPELGLAGVRSFMARPAYSSHPRLQRGDTQAKHYADYVHDADDNGSVHANSGIANHAFYLAATRLGGKAWERAGRIWFEAFVKLVPNADFAAAALKTVRTADTEFKDAEAAEAFRGAWAAVGIKIEA